MFKGNYFCNCRRSAKYIQDAPKRASDVISGESGIYRFPDAQYSGKTRTGMATDLRKRLGQHRRSGKLSNLAEVLVTIIETYGASGRDARRLRALAEQEQQEELLQQGQELSDVYRSVAPDKR